MGIKFVRSFFPSQIFSFQSGPTVIGLLPIGNRPIGNRSFTGLNRTLLEPPKLEPELKPVVSGRRDRISVKVSVTGYRFGLSEIVTS